VRVAEPPLAASEAQPHKMTKPTPAWRKRQAKAGHRVSDGTRTRDHLDHNQVLYQLSYTHHCRPNRDG
jgi:hypothetical protein